MNFLRSLWKWLKQAKISPWNTTIGELDSEVKVPGTGRVGSYEENQPNTEKIKGIKVTLPLPEGK